jgi:hypothetical protein
MSGYPSDSRQCDARPGVPAGAVCYGRASGDFLRQVWWPLSAWKDGWEALPTIAADDSHHLKLDDPAWLVVAEGLLEDHSLVHVS